MAMFSEGKIKFNNWYTAILTAGKNIQKKEKRISFSRKALKYLGIIYPLLRDVLKQSESLYEFCCICCKICKAKIYFRENAPSQILDSP